MLAARLQFGTLAAVAATCSVAVLLAFAGTAAAASCDGKHATIVGTAGNDVIVGKKAARSLLWTFVRSGM